MSDLPAIEKLQPCLLDRLTDDDPGKQEESRNQRVVSLGRYRKGVLRDLEWLFNSSATLTSSQGDFNLADYPEARRSVLNFGVRQLCGISTPDLEKLQQELTESVQFFEPRITARSLLIHADMERNVVTLEINGDLWAHPLPDHLHVKTLVDVETGQCLFGDSLYGPATA